MLELRTFEKADSDRLISWIPDARFLLRFAGPEYSFPLDKAQLEETIRKTREDNPKHYMFKVVHVLSDEVIGHIEIMRVNYEKRTAHLGRVLIGNPDDRGKGYGIEMVSLALHFAFNSIGLNELTLGVFDFNTPAIACYKGLGFKEYEFKENARPFEDEYWNLILMKLNKDDWLRIQQEC